MCTVIVKYAHHGIGNKQWKGKEDKKYCALLSTMINCSPKARHCCPYLPLFQKQISFCSAWNS